MSDYTEELGRETAEATPAPVKKARLPLTHSLWAKMLAFALVIVSIAVMVLLSAHAARPL